MQPLVFLYFVDAKLQRKIVILKIPGMEMFLYLHIVFRSDFLFIYLVKDLAQLFFVEDVVAYFFQILFVR